MISTDDFDRLTGPFRPELLAHCYRMLGSIHDAEDQLQETLLRAWRSYDAFEGRSSVRTWLYKIATNACLRALENRVRRPLPSGLGAPADDPAGPLAASRHEVAWLEPFPDVLLGTEAADPASVVAARAGMRLALIAALQFLPPRQRAVLLLRDVLAWRASEVAELLGVSTAAVNSVLQRARAHLQRVAPAADDVREPGDPELRELLDRYAMAFEKADMAALMEVLTEDAVFEMPPVPTWFAGREAIREFLLAKVLRGPRDIRMVPVRANGGPAFAVFRGGGPHSIHVPEFSGTRIARVVSFQDPALLKRFGLWSAL